MQPNLNISNSHCSPTSFRSFPYALNKGASQLYGNSRERNNSLSNSKNYLPTQGNNNSQTSQPNFMSRNYASQLIKRLEDVNMYPAGFAQILKNEEKNMKNFKKKINKEKQKIDEDISSFKVQLNHSLQDLRLSLHAHLDRIYQKYLEKTAAFRGEIFQINRLKQQLEIQLGATSFGELQSKIKMDNMQINKKFNFAPERDVDKNIQTSAPQHTQNSYYSLNNNSNSVQMKALQTISHMQVGNQQLKNYHILNYISEVQKQRVPQLQNLQRQLTMLNFYENNFYQSNQFIKVLSKLRELMNIELKKVYHNNYAYIRDFEYLIQKEKQKQKKILDGLDMTQTKVNNNTGFVPIVSNIQENKTILSQTLRHGIVSNSQQSFKAKSIQNITLTEERSEINSSSGSKQQAICGLLINNQIVLGFKNGTIQVFSCDGHSIAILNQHKSNICTLAVAKVNHENFLISGSDVGCSKIIVWDPVTWKLKFFWTVHNAAVTGIVDLQDDMHLVSTGYDKKLNILSIKDGKHITQVCSAQSPLTNLLVNKSGSKLIASGLDKAIYIWQIIRNYHLKAQNIVLERKIQNNSVISSIVSSQITPQMIVVATKDCKVKLVNIEKGESYKTISFQNVQSPLSSSFPLQVLIIEREDKPYYPIALCWTYREQKIYQINCETGSTSVKNCGLTGGHLQYGYGVSPKCIFVADVNKGLMIYSVNHSAKNRENNCISAFRVEQTK